MIVENKGVIFDSEVVKQTIFYALTNDKVGTDVNFVKKMQLLLSEEIS